MNWTARRPLIKLLIVGSLVLVALGLVLAMVAVATGYWSGLGSAATALIGGGVGYWLATTYGGKKT